MNRASTLAAILVVFGVSGVALAKGDVAAGKIKAASCTSCHGVNGEGKAAYPPLAGKSEDEIEHALEDYKSGKRANGVMKSFAGKLSSQDIENLAAYYSSLKK